MQKVVNISLNGIAYQLEEAGYNQLHSYLERAESRLKDSPDRTEVMNDLEQAIGEKCARVLGPHKTVVNEAEVAKIIEEMGPVESAEEKAAGAAPEGAPEQASPYTGTQPRKRLFNIREGAMWAGVCNGIAAYINVDVTWVRIAFALVTIFSWGGMILVYIALAFIVPTAETAEDRAAAFGMPFNTEELIGRAKKNFEKFGSDYRWRREWRRQQRHWNRQWHQMSEQVRQATAQAAPQMGNTTRAIMGVAFSGDARRYPNIRFIWSHAGGTVPFLAGRIEGASRGAGDRLPDGFTAAINRFYYDLAGATNRGAVASLLQLVTPSQVLFGTDFPPGGTSAEYVKALAELGMFSAADVRAIERENAVRLLPRLA